MHSSSRLDRQLYVSRTKTKTLGPWGFYYASSAVWSLLPANLRDPGLSLHSYRTKLIDLFRFFHFITVAFSPVRATWCLLVGVCKCLNWIESNWDRKIPPPRILYYYLKHYYRVINIGIYKLVRCCKWSDVIGQIHPTSWQYVILLLFVLSWRVVSTLHIWLYFSYIQAELAEQSSSLKSSTDAEIENLRRENKEPSRFANCSQRSLFTVMGFEPVRTFYNVSHFTHAKLWLEGWPISSARILEQNILHGCSPYRIWNLILVAIYCTYWNVTENITVHTSIILVIFCF